MDETTETFIKLICYMMIAPFWIAWKVIGLIWQFIVKPLNQTLADRSADQQRQQNTDANRAKQDARQAARAKQLADLQAAVPQTVPERMRATIQINSFKVAQIEQKQIKRLLAEDSFIYIEDGERTHYAVDMVLQLSETERAIIKEHELHDLVMEDDPELDQHELRRLAHQDQQEAEATKDPILRAVKEGTNEITQALRKDARSETRLGDYLVAPFTRTFDTPHQANEYALKLKTKILPQIRKHLDTYREHQQSQTIEF